MAKRGGEDNRKWRAKNPLAYSAHMILAAAIRAGKIVAQSCENCGAKGHAHHEDYSRPLDVRWLCSRHHREHHALQKGQTLHERHEPKPVQWPYRAKFQPSPKRDAGLEQARELRAQGLSYQEIAESLGTVKGQIYKWLNPKDYK